ncbi:hypothetical protein [Streptomyces sp. NPDC054786]
MPTPSSRDSGTGRIVRQEADLLRLQQILLMRELDLGLREIQTVLDSQADRNSRHAQVPVVPGLLTAPLV